ncbi:MAG: ester cyclase [Chloroflexia bacterium]
MTQTTQEAQNKAIFHRWFNDVWNGGKYEVAQEVIAPTMLVHGAGGQPVEMGPDGLVGLVSTWRNAFPDGQMYIDGLVAEGDLVAALLTWRGTHEADFYGIAPTGKQVVCVSIGIDRMANNQVVAGWGELDMVGMIQQMGGLPMVGFGASAHGGSPEWGESRAPVEPTGPPSEENRSLMLRYVQARNDRDLDAMCEMIDDSSYVEHNPSWAQRTWRAR